MAIRLITYVHITNYKLNLYHVDDVKRRREERDDDSDSKKVTT